MSINKIIKYLYIIIITYLILLLICTNINPIDLLPSIIVIILVISIFLCGYNYKKPSTSTNFVRNKGNLLMNRKSFSLILLGILSLLLSVIACNFYTGKSFFEVIGNIGKDTSLYYEYQKYAADNIFNSSSIQRLPYIVMVYYVKFIFFYGNITFFLCKKKRNGYEWLFIFLITFAHIYISMARGTSLEIFELLLLFSFIIFSKKDLNYKNLFKKIIIVLGFAVAGGYIYYSNIIARGNDLTNLIKPSLTNEFTEMRNIPLLSYIVVLFYGYFGFGPVYLSRYLINLGLSDVSNFILMLIPNGINMKVDIGWKLEMEKYVFVNFKWIPDIVPLINILGMIGFLFFIFLIGVYLKYISFYYRDNEGLVYLSNFLALLIMFSLPIGIFVSASSSTMLIIFTVIVLWVFKMKKIKIKHFRICVRRK